MKTAAALAALILCACGHVEPQRQSSQSSQSSNHASHAAKAPQHVPSPAPVSRAKAR